MLNDFARYWRTMAVDFAYKHRKRQGKGAAIRNLKLRFSRKLLFAAALLSCFSCQVQVARDVDPAPCPQTEAECIDCLRAFLRKTPLEVLAAVVLHLLDRAANGEAAAALAAAASDTLTSYDRFIGILADETKRRHLEQLSPEDIDDDPEFQAARGASHAFRDGLLRIFFDTELAELTRFYGVF